MRKEPSKKLNLTILISEINSNYDNELIHLLPMGITKPRDIKKPFPAKPLESDFLWEKPKNLILCLISSKSILSLKTYSVSNVKILDLSSVRCFSLTKLGILNTEILHNKIF